MATCERCNSHAINHRHHGRDGSDPNLCDVCYWRKRAEISQADTSGEAGWLTAPPLRNGRYIVCGVDNEPREARWQTKKQKWTFPSAQSAFVPTHYRLMPDPPKSREDTK